MQTRRPRQAETEMTEELLRGLERDGLVAKMRDERGNLVMRPNSRGVLQVVWQATSAGVRWTGGQIH